MKGMAIHARAALFGWLFASTHQPRTGPAAHSTIERGYFGHIPGRSRHHLCSSALQYTLAIKNEYLRSSAPLSKVVYDDTIKNLNNALGLHSYISRVQGQKLKAKNEIRIASVFKRGPD